MTDIRLIQFGSRNSVKAATIFVLYQLFMNQEIKQYVLLIFTEITEHNSLMRFVVGWVIADRTSTGFVRHKGDHLPAFGFS